MNTPEQTNLEKLRDFLAVKLVAVYKIPLIGQDAQASVYSRLIELAWDHLPAQLKTAIASTANQLDPTLTSYIFNNLRAALRPIIYQWLPLLNDQEKEAVRTTIVNTLMEQAAAGQGYQPA